jgi:hypothetical protein
MSSMIDKRIGEKTLNREPATVISVDSAYKRAVIEFLNGSRFMLLNKTGEKLYVGDSVWVNYNKLPASGYIAMRNGEADPLGGGAGGLILHNGIVVTADQSGVYAGISLSDQIINVNNNEKYYYSKRQYQNQETAPIVVDGNLIFPQLTGTLPTVTEDGFTYTVFPAKYANRFMSSITLDNINYSWKLVYATDRPDSYESMAQWRVQRNGSDIANAGQNNTIYTRTPYQNYGSPMFYITYSDIRGPDDIHTFGYANLSIGGALMYSNKRLAQVSVADPEATYGNIGIQDFKSQAEYDYAVGLTKYTSLPPSLDTGDSSNE